MKLTLSNLNAQRLLLALKSIDNNEAAKLAGTVRLDIARNINRMMPDVAAFELTAGKIRRGLLPGNDKADANKVIMDEFDDLGQKAQVYKLLPMEIAQLRLDDNPHITGELVAALAPLIKDFDTMEEAGD